MRVPLLYVVPKMDYKDIHYQQELYVLVGQQRLVLFRQIHQLQMVLITGHGRVRTLDKQ